MSLCEAETEVPLPAEEEKRSQIQAGRWPEKGAGGAEGAALQPGAGALVLGMRKEDPPRQPREEGGASNAVTALLSRLLQPLPIRGSGYAVPGREGPSVHLVPRRGGDWPARDRKCSTRWGGGGAAQSPRCGSPSSPSTSWLVTPLCVSFPVLKVGLMTVLTLLLGPL